MRYKGMKIGKGITTSIAMAFISLLTLTATAMADTAWNAEITASYQDDSNKVILGAAEGATDGFENGYEGRAIVSGSLTANFRHPEWGVDTEYFWSDIKATDLPKEWTFYVTSAYTNKSIKLKWELNTVPDTLQLTLIDDSLGTSVDMKAQSLYSYTNTSGVARTFRVQASGTIPPTPDTTPPDTSIIDMADYSYINNTNVNISYTGNDNKSAQMALEYSYMLDGSSWSSWSTSTNASLIGLTQGAHTFTVKAMDESGNEDPTPAQISFTVDTAAPIVSLTANAGQPSIITNSSSAAFSFTSSEAGSTFHCMIDAGGYSPCTSPKSYTGLNSDSHTFDVIAFDLAGNQSSSPASYAWTVDNSPLAVTLNSVTSPTNSNSQTVTGTVEAGVTVTVATDTAASDGTATVTGLTWSYTITGLVAGVNNITVTATNALGNTATVAGSITLDITPPLFSSVSPISVSFINTAIAGYSLSKAVSSGKITFTRTGGSADPISHAYEFTASDISAGTHSVNTGLVLVSGAIYTMSFEAIDNAGNPAPAASSTDVIYDSTAALVILTSPAANGIVNNARASYTLSEDISAGQIVFTRTGGSEDPISPHVNLLSASERTKDSHTVDTAKSLMDGAVYTVSFENVKDMAGNATTAISNANVKYDITAAAITNTSPAASSVISSASVGYKLSKDASQGKVTFTRTGGKADSSSPHVYNIQTTDLAMGAHNISTNLNLVEGAFYTVSFEATDLAGNPATTVSNAMVYYDSSHGIGPVGNLDNTGHSAKRVDGFDLIKLSVVFGSSSGDAGWNPICDLNKDGRVDGNDLIMLGNHFGEAEQ